VIGLVRVEYRDGRTEDIITDSTWRTAPSPVVFSSIYGGEDYDARLEQKGWNTAVFNDAAWRNVVYVDGPPLHEQQEAPLKVWERFAGKRVAASSASDASTAPGAKMVEPEIYDLGQNISGIVRIRVRGHRGDTVRIIPGELMHPDGTANQRATGSPYYFTYILKGEGVETWTPQFSYYGFRYLQVETPATLLDIQGLHTSSEGPPVGSFSCSNELFNRINSLIRWSIRNNMASVLTDCPTREKLGWLEQTNLMGNSIQYNYDLSRLYRKMIGDMMMAQTSGGLIPEIAPEYTVSENPSGISPEWGSAAILLPWNLYQWYGDSVIVGESYEMMQRYMAYLGTKADHYILTQGLGDWYDIGPAKPGFSQLTPKGLTATGFLLL
jgi:alpha-L-rhamnosidase